MSRDSFLQRNRQGTGQSHRRSKRQEKELALRGGGRRVSRSGAGPEKGDIKKYAGIFRLEAKTTSRKSFSITREMIDKITEASLTHNEYPAIVVEFTSEQGRRSVSVAVVPLDVLDILGVIRSFDAAVTKKA